MIGSYYIRYNGKLVKENSRFAFNERIKQLRKINKRLLSILRSFNVKLTFFVTGAVYEADPDIVHAIYEDGHEIGWHGHSHSPITDIDTLKNSLTLSKKFIRTFSPKGFRAPWVLFDESFIPILKDSGFLYDSSVFGPAGYQYEISGVKIFPVTSFPNLFFSKPQYVLNEKLIYRLRSFPLGSNFMFSLLRYKFSWLLRYFEKNSQGCIFYLHNWQLFPWPERRVSLFRNKLRYVQKFPLYHIIQYLIAKHKFLRLDSKINSDVRRQGHYLTFDIE